MINKMKGMQPIIRCRKMVQFILSCILLTGVCALHVKAAASNELSVEIAYGFNQITKTDSNTPLTISVTNNGNEFNGTIQVILSSVSSSNSSAQAILLNGYKEKNYMYEKPVCINAYTTRIYP